MSMRTLVLVVLCACNKEKPVEPVKTEVVVAAVDGTRTNEPSLCPSWSDGRACKADGFAYASAKGPGTSALSVTTASNRARAVLVGDKGQIEQSEITGVASCADGVHALARAPLANVADTNITACSTAMNAPAPEAGCPEWTTRRAYRDGSSVFAVAVIDAKLSPALAQTQADNAARAEAQKYFNFTAKTEGGALSTGSSGTLPAMKDRERVDCAGKSYVRLSFTAP